MGMFDWYRPDPPIACPECGRELSDWQGKDGPCGLMVWSQGVAHPIDQPVEEECRWSDEELRRFRLPSSVAIYASDEQHWIDARAIVENGTWRRTEIVGVMPIGDKVHPHQRRARRKKG
jgi:hypothetical protein